MTAFQSFTNACSVQASAGRSLPTCAPYIGVAPGTFDKLVREGSMPRAKRVSEGRLAWDVRSLDAAIDLLPSDGVSKQTDDSWSDVDAA